MTPFKLTISSVKDKAQPKLWEDEFLFELSILTHAHTYLVMSSIQTTLDQEEFKQPKTLLEELIFEVQLFPDLEDLDIIGGKSYSPTAVNDKLIGIMKEIQNSVYLVNAMGRYFVSLTFEDALHDNAFYIALSKIAGSCHIVSADQNKDCHEIAKSLYTYLRNPDL